MLALTLENVLLIRLCVKISNEREQVRQSHFLFKTMENTDFDVESQQIIALTVGMAGQNHNEIFFEFTKE